MKPVKQSKSSISEFLRDETGAATVETVLCIPIFAMLLGLVVDTSIIFARQAEALRIIQDANRSLSIGLTMTAAAAQSAIEARLAPISPNVQVTTTIVDDTLINSRAVMPASDLSSLGLFPAFTGLLVTVSAQHLTEG